jgi:hypothetical protein
MRPDPDIPPGPNEPETPIPQEPSIPGPPAEPETPPIIPGPEVVPPSIPDKPDMPPAPRATGGDEQRDLVIEHPDPKHKHAETPNS